MDRRKKYMIVIDCETAPLDNSLSNVKADNMLAYDIGFAVIDKKGTVYKQYSFINTDIFLDEADLMKSAYYAKKIPMYWIDIKAGIRKLAHMTTIWSTFCKVIKEYNVKEVYAHNAYFDYTALNRTLRYNSKSKFRYFFPKDITICDTLKMTRSILGKSKMYKEFCNREGYLTKTGLPRFNAETLYKYISGDYDFVESHTGLEDVMIEKDFVTYCYKAHKAMKKKLWTDKRKYREMPYEEIESFLEIAEKVSKKAFYDFFEICYLSKGII